MIKTQSKNKEIRQIEGKVLVKVWRETGAPTSRLVIVRFLSIVDKFKLKMAFFNGRYKK